MDDLINRQAAIDVIEKWLECSDYNEAERHIMRATESILYDLPSVNPQPKTGHWIIYKDCEGKTRQCTCDRCGYKTGKYTWHNPNFCSNCGAKMVEPQERSE